MGSTVSEGESEKGLTRRGLLGAAAAAGGAALLPPQTAAASSGGAVPTTPTAVSGSYDVVVVGAGLAGLTAANAIQAAGHTVLVLEGRDRVGGRNLDLPLVPGAVLEMGGEYTGPGQTEVQALAKSLGIGLFETYSKGESIYYTRKGSIKRFEGEVPPASKEALEQIGGAVAQLENMAKGVNPARPWAAVGAGEYDIQTVSGWIRSNLRNREAINLFELAVRANSGEEGSQISLLEFLADIAGIGGELKTALGTGQSMRFVGGPQQMSEKLAEKLTLGVQLNSPVREIQQGSTAVVVTPNGSAKASQVIITPPKPVTARIIFSPELPATYAQYFQRQPMGATVKVQVVYPEPFWRARGLNGNVVSEVGPIQTTYDNSPPSGSPGVIIAFVEGNFGRSLFLLSEEERRAVVLSSLQRFFGRRASKPTGYADEVWAREAFTLGAYGSQCPPGVLTSLGEDVAAYTVGNLRFAGSDYSPEWPGYMEGAIRSGSAAAEAAIKAL